MLFRILNKKIKKSSFCALCPQNGTVYFYDCNQFVSLRKRPNRTERSSYPRLVRITGIYSEVEQGNVTDAKQSGNTTHS